MLIERYLTWLRYSSTVQIPLEIWFKPGSYDSRSEYRPFPGRVVKLKEIQQMSLRCKVGSFLRRQWPLFMKTMLVSGLFFIGLWPFASNLFSRKLTNALDYNSWCWLLWANWLYISLRCYGFLKGDLSLKKNMSSQSGCSVPVLCLLKAWLLIATIVLIGRLCPEQHSSHFSHFLPAGTSSRGMLWGKEKSHLSDTCAVACAQRGLFPTTSGLC